MPSIIKLPSEPFVGKIIIFRQHPSKFEVAAASAKELDWWIEQFCEAKDEEILHAIHLLPKIQYFDELFGFHREIPHYGEVLGGAVAFHSGRKLFLNSYSQAYGPLSRNLVLHALDQLGVPVVMGADIT